WPASRRTRPRGGSRRRFRPRQGTRRGGRGPYCGCHGYLGFNRESQLAITIRTAVVRGRRAWYPAGAGIVADSLPEAEYDETLAKARGFLEAAGVEPPAPPPPARPRPPAGLTAAIAHPAPAP
ncbi:MAG: chorismate-binding protein, partial [Verrucomicrobiota bacterium]